MANRDNHYEAAFEQYLRERGIPYVAVDEAKRSVLSNGASIKSLDFIGHFCPNSLPATQMLSTQGRYGVSAIPVIPGRSRFLPIFSGRFGEI
jgi:hypothetical protein